MHFESARTIEMTFGNILLYILINMHREILTKEQIELLPVLKNFMQDFGLVGGTAAALYMGHRRSIDFDMFSMKPFDNDEIRKKLTQAFPIDQELVDRKGEY